MEIATIRKAIVPFVIGGVLVLLSYIGITSDMTVGEALDIAVTAAFTAFFVWLVPNKTKK